MSGLGVDFEVRKSDAPEVSYPEDPERTVRENALAKGAYISASQHLNTSTSQRSNILSADTIVWFNGKIYGKPDGLEGAKSFLRELSGNTHTVFTGVAFNGEAKVVRSDVTFKVLSDATIESYVTKVNPVDRAGAYDIDTFGEMLVEGYTGTYENIMGLPVEPLKEWRICP